MAHVGALGNNLALKARPATPVKVKALKRMPCFITRLCVTHARATELLFRTSVAHAKVKVYLPSIKRYLSMSIDLSKMDTVSILNC